MRMILNIACVVAFSNVLNAAEPDTKYHWITVTENGFSVSRVASDFITPAHVHGPTKLIIGGKDLQFEIKNDDGESRLTLEGNEVVVHAPNGVRGKAEKVQFDSGSNTLLMKSAKLTLQVANGSMSQLEAEEIRVRIDGQKLQIHLDAPTSVSIESPRTPYPTPYSSPNIPQYGTPTVTPPTQSSPFNPYQPTYQQLPQQSYGPDQSVPVYPNAKPVPQNSTS